MVYRVPAGTQMTVDLLAEYIGKHKTDVGRRLIKFDAAYRGDYAIFYQKAKPRWKPDNRIALGFAKYIVDTMNGYFLGIPVVMQHKDTGVSDFLENVSKWNDLDDVNAELGKFSDTFGIGNEIYYTDEDSNICVQQISPMESFMIVDDSVLERPMFFVRYYRDSKNVERGSYSDANIVQHFVRNGSYMWEGEPTEHHFDGVPATEFIENSERLGLLDGVMAAIDAYNNALSEKANDVDAFADAYMKIIGPKISDPDIQFIRDNRIVNLQTDDVGSADVDFMQKPNGDETQENLLNRLYRGIFQTTMVADLSDENFAGSASGVAMQYKLQAMSNLAESKKRKFEAGLNRRFRILFSHPLCPVSPDEWIGIDYKFTKNIPSNLLEETEIAKNLEGVVTKEKQLSVLSIVDNPKKEAEAVENSTAQVPMVETPEKKTDTQTDTQQEVKDEQP